MNLFQSCCGAEFGNRKIWDRDMNTDMSKKKTLCYAVTVAIILATVFACCASAFVLSDRVYAFNNGNMTNDASVTIKELLLNDYDTAKQDSKIFNGVE